MLKKGCLSLLLFLFFSSVYADKEPIPRELENINNQLIDIQSSMKDRQRELRNFKPSFPNQTPLTQYYYQKIETIQNNLLSLNQTKYNSPEDLTKALRDYKTLLNELKSIEKEMEQNRELLGGN